MKTELITELKEKKNFNKLHVVALTGLKGTGKSTFAEMLGKELKRQGCKVEYCGFAEELKTEIIQLFCDGYMPWAYADEFFTPELKRDYPPIRKLLQEWGDWRKTQDPDYWLNAWVNKACQQLVNWNWEDAEDGVDEAEPGVKVIIIPDLRFHAERAILAGIFERNVLFARLTKRDAIASDRHNSETEQTSIEVHTEIPNDGTLYDLEAEARRISLLLET